MNLDFKAFYLLFHFITLIHSNIAERSFYIDFKSDSFMKDGKPFRYVSGSIHSYRVPSDYWQDRLDKIWAAGLNAIQIYVFWNEHEPNPGVYDFSGQNDILKFIELAHKTGLLVILRPGPYICGEHEYGGLPWWLLSNGVEYYRPRTSEKTYINAVNKWLEKFLPMIVPYLYKNGGPIITVQVENEYGSYSTSDHVYTSHLRDLFRKYLSDETILFTTDGDAISYLHGGTINGTYATVDFGVGTNIREAFNAQRVYSPQGPLVNSEFYPGWLDFWGHAHSKIGTPGVIRDFETMMNMNANVNFYMFHGGTNFGFSNGADPTYKVQPTSYDYDAPISEAGDITQKYLAIRESISKYMPLPKVNIPANQTKTAYGKVEMKWSNPLKDVIQNLSENCIKTEFPESFEKLGQGYGFIMYSTVLEDANVHGKKLSIPGTRDRAYVMIGSELVGVLDRMSNVTDLTFNITENKETNLNIIVENMGRLNYGGFMLDNKGIVSDVYLNGEILKNWETCLTNNFIPNFQNSHLLHMLMKLKHNINEINTSKYKLPSVYIGEFYVNNSDSTFLKMNSFTKGIAIVGSGDKFTNVGKYWPHMGPQVTLYTPGAFLRPNSYNQIILIEFESSLCDDTIQCFVEFIDYPIIDNL